MKPQELLQEVKVSVLATLALIVILCGLYPLVVWGIAQVAFPSQANGSLINVKGQVAGQPLAGPKLHCAAVFPPPALGGGRHRL